MKASPERSIERRITVVGLGYVGTAMAVLLARHNEVTALDIDSERVNNINRGVSPVTDTHVSEFLGSQDLKLRATTNAEDALSSAEFIVIATPTDYDPEEDFFDTSSVESVIELASSLAPTATIVIKSTVPVGFTAQAQQQHPDMTILFSPEFLREGRALEDNLRPSRIIVAGPSEPAHDFAAILLEGALEPVVPVLVTDTTEAEAIKLFANTFLAIRVAFFNELDTFAVNHGLSAKEIVAGVSLDPRIGNYYNNPSFGYGGYCLPKDTKQLLANYDSVPQNLIRAVVDANFTRKSFIVSEILKSNPEVVGIYRLAMKAGSDNFRSSATHSVARMLQKEGAEVVLYEPLLDTSVFDGIEVVSDLDMFKNRSSIIIANRSTVELEDVEEKVFTRDIFGRD